ncbi:MAG: cation diffusion facilitator family transporter [Nannocystaceae bacterium]
MSHHHHDHGQVPRASRAFAIATGLNLVFVVVEFVYGMLAESMALVADAAHNLGDVAGLLLAWGASVLARRRPTSDRTYGYGKATILAALANALLLVASVGAVFWEALGRLSTPREVDALTVVAVATVGVVINGIGVALFAHGHEDVNVRAAFLHLAADTVVSGGVVVTGLVLMVWNWAWLDPTVSLAISLVILYTSWSLLRDSFNLSMDAVPRGVDIDAISGFLHEQPGVLDVHDLHVWAMSTNENALTAHVVAELATDRGTLLHDIDNAMRERFQICHSTIQIEPPDAGACVKDHPDE